jgi:ubiquinone/menaquinone biosynthesis C-methylase UbiE
MQEDDPLAPFWAALNTSPELARHAAIYQWAAKQFPPGASLDLGSEYGFGSRLLERANPALHVIGIDADYSTLQTARSLEKPGVLPLRLVNARGEALPFSAGSFNSACLIHLLHLVEDPASILREVRRVLCEAGILVCALPAGDHPLSLLDEVTRLGDLLFARFLSHQAGRDTGYIWIMTAG